MADYFVHPLSGRRTAKTGNCVRIRQCQTA